MTAYTMPSGRYERGGDYDITPAGTHGWNLVRIAVIVAILTSAGWYWQLREERMAHRQQIVAERVAAERRVTEAIHAPLKLSQPRILTIEYDDGAKVKVAIKEVTP